MKNLKFGLLAAIAAACLLLLTGCFETMDPCRSELPWAKPAPWQDTTPGVSF